MEEIRYPRKRFAELLGMTDAELAIADASEALAPLGGRRDAYQPADLSAYRAALGRHPERRTMRRQLFLNFKGGTGKTSLSTSYAYRLAELGHRVLLLDLDSPGHAT